MQDISAPQFRRDRLGTADNSDDAMEYLRITDLVTGARERSELCKVMKKRVKKTKNR